MGQPVPMQVPLRGLQTLDPFIDFESLYARELTNYALLNGSLLMRAGVNVSLEGAVALAADQMIWYAKSGSDYYGISANDGKIYNIVTGAYTGTTLSIPDGVSPPTQVKHVSLDLVIGVGEPRLAAYPFTGWTFTSTLITDTQISSACSHKGRLYISQGTIIQYSKIGQITGALDDNDKINISYFLKGQTVSRMFSVTAQTGDMDSGVLVIFGSEGLVLVCTGSYPGDPNWRIAFEFSMPPPASRLSFVERNGDIFVATSLYPYWFRDLFSGGAQTAFDNRPSVPIDNLWKAFSWDLPYSGVPPKYLSHCFYYKPLNCIVCQAYSTTAALQSKIANYQNDSGYLIYHLDYKAWSMWLMTPFFYPIRELSDGNYMGQQYSPCVPFLQLGLAVDESFDGSSTTSIDIETSWKSPYFYPQAGKNRLLGGVKPFFKNSVSGYLHLLRGIFDMTDYNSPFGFYTQSTAPAQINPGYYTEGKIDVPAQTWGVYSEFSGVGGNGAGFSIQMTQKRKSGSTSSQTQEIFNAAVTLNEGAAYPS